MGPNKLFKSPDILEEKIENFGFHEAYRIFLVTIELQEITMILDINYKYFSYNIIIKRISKIIIF